MDFLEGDDRFYTNTEVSEALIHEAEVETEQAANDLAAARERLTQSVGPVKLVRGINWGVKWARHTLSLAHLNDLRADYEREAFPSVDLE